MPLKIKDSQINMSDNPLFQKPPVVVTAQRVRSFILEQHDQKYQDRANQLFGEFMEKATPEQVQRVLRHFKRQEEDKTDQDCQIAQSNNEYIRKRFETEVVRELCLRKYQCKRSQKKIERYRKEIDKINPDNFQYSAKLDLSAEDGKSSVKVDLASIDISKTKFDIGVLGGVISLSKSEEIRKVYGQNSLYYTITHSDSQQIHTSQRYLIPHIRDFSLDESFADQLKPVWRELFSLNLSGLESETILFELIRHNSTKGDLQIDHFELKPREDPLFLQLLIDQSPHTLPFKSEIESIYKVQIRWRHQEELLKKDRDRKKIAQISGMIDDERKILESRTQAYKMLMDLESLSPDILLSLLGINQLQQDSNMVFIEQKSNSDPNKSAYTALNVYENMPLLESQQYDLVSDLNKQNEESVVNRQSLLKSKSSRKVIAKAKTPIAFDSKPTRNIILSPMNQQDFQYVNTPHKGSLIQRKSIDLGQHTSNILDERQKIIKQYQSFLASHNLSVENNIQKFSQKNSNNKSPKTINHSRRNKSITPHSSSLKAEVNSIKQRASACGIVPYQKSQYVGIASFISSQSVQNQPGSNISPDLNKKQVVEAANMPLQSGGGRSDSLNQLKYQQNNIRKSMPERDSNIQIINTNQKKHVPKLDSRFLMKPQTPIEMRQPILSARVCNQKIIAFGTSHTPCNKHYQSIMLSSSRSPSSKVKNKEMDSTNSRKSIAGSQAQQPPSTKKLSLEQKIFYEKRLFNIPPPLFSSRAVLQQIKQKKKKKTVKKQGLKYSVQQQPQFKSMDNRDPSRNNGLSAGSYSISDQFNSRQSVDEDQRYFYSDPQQDQQLEWINVKVAEIKIEDNPHCYEDVKIETQHSQESLIDDNSLNPVSTSSIQEQEEYEEVKTEEMINIIVEPNSEKQVAVLNLNLIDEVKEDSSSQTPSQHSKIAEIQTSYQMEASLQLAENQEDFLHEDQRLNFEQVIKEVKIEDKKVEDIHDSAEYNIDIEEEIEIPDEHNNGVSEVVEQTISPALTSSIEEIQESKVEEAIIYQSSIEILEEAQDNQTQEIAEDQNTLVIDLNPTQSSDQQEIQLPIKYLDEQEPKWIDIPDTQDFPDQIVDMIELDIPTESVDKPEQTKENANSLIKEIQEEEQKELNIKEEQSNQFTSQIKTEEEVEISQIKHEDQQIRQDQEDQQKLIQAVIEEEQRVIQKEKESMQKEMTLKLIDQQILQLTEEIERIEIQIQSAQKINQEQQPFVKNHQVQNFSVQMNPFIELLKTIDALVCVENKQINVNDRIFESIQINLQQEYIFFEIKVPLLNYDRNRIQNIHKIEESLVNKFIEVQEIVLNLQKELNEFKGIQISLDLSKVREQFIQQKIEEEEQERLILASRPPFQPYQTPETSSDDSFQIEEEKIQEAQVLFENQNPQQDQFIVEINAENKTEADITEEDQIVDHIISVIKDSINQEGTSNRNQALPTNFEENVQNLDNQIINNTYFTMLSLPIIVEEPLHKEFSAPATDTPSSIVQEEPEQVIKVLRQGRASTARSALINPQQLTKPQTFTVEFVEKRQEQPQNQNEEYKTVDDAGLLPEFTAQVLDNQSKKSEYSSSNEDEEDEEFVFLTDLVPGHKDTLHDEKSSSSSSLSQGVVEDVSIQQLQENITSHHHLETLKEDSHDEESHSSQQDVEDSKSQELAQLEIKESYQTEADITVQEDQVQFLNAGIFAQPLEPENQILSPAEENNDDLVMGFLDGTQYITSPKVEEEKIPVNAVEEHQDDLSNQSEKCNSQKLSDIDSDHEFQVGQNPDSLREILAPTFENMKRMQLKLQRQSNSLATSNFLEQLGNQIQRQQSQQEEAKIGPFELADSQLNIHQQPPSLQPFLFPTALRPSLPAFKRSPLIGGGPRSSYHESQQQPLRTAADIAKNYLAKSMYSAQSTQSMKIGMLMKGIEGGSIFMRHALKKPQQRSPNESQISGSEEYGRGSQPMIFKNQQLPSENGSAGNSDHQNSQTNRSSQGAQMLMNNPMMKGFGMYVAAGIQMPINLMQTQQQQQRPPQNDQ